MNDENKYEEVMEAALVEAKRQMVDSLARSMVESSAEEVRRMVTIEIREQFGEAIKAKVESMVVDQRAARPHSSGSAVGGIFQHR